MNRTLAVVLVAIALSGCRTQWQSLAVEDISYSDLYGLTLHVIDSEGFQLSWCDIHEGEITTTWNYSKITDTGRFPIRRRLEARIDPESQGSYQVKLRIEQEANWEGYGISDPKLSDAWDDYGWDREKASLILKKIEIQTREYEPSDAFYERYRRAERLKTEVPDVLE